MTSSWFDDPEPLEVVVARVAVRVVDFGDGVLPRVCASSGDEATRLHRMQARHNPWWPLALISWDRSAHR
jgi:hypothetical protein